MSCSFASSAPHSGVGLVFAERLKRPAAEGKIKLQVKSSRGRILPKAITSQDTTSTAETPESNAQGFPTLRGHVLYLL